MLKRVQPGCCRWRMAALLLSGGVLCQFVSCTQVGATLVSGLIKGMLDQWIQGFIFDALNINIPFFL